MYITIRMFTFEFSCIHTIEPTGFIIAVGDQEGDSRQHDVSWEDDLATPLPSPPPIAPLPQVSMSRDASKGSESMEMSSVGSPDSECTSHNKSSSTEGLNESGEPLIQCTDNNNIATCMCTCM